MEADFLKVTDFGLVKAAPEVAPDQAKLTAPGLTTGTPAFMAPELAMNDHPDWRVDIYALGCVAYWLLTGRLVFEAETPMRMMVRHIEGSPMPPSSVSELDIPRELDELVLACLHKDRRQRPSDALRLAARLADLDLRESWTQESAAQWWRTNVPEIMPPIEAPVPPAVSHAAAVP